MPLFLIDLLRLASFTNSQPSFVNYKESNTSTFSTFYLFLLSVLLMTWCWVCWYWKEMGVRVVIGKQFGNSLSHSRAYQRLRRYFTKIDWQGHANRWRKKCHANWWEKNKAIFTQKMPSCSPEGSFWQHIANPTPDCENSDFSTIMRWC